MDCVAVLGSYVVLFVLLLIATSTRIRKQVEILKLRGDTTYDRALRYSGRGSTIAEQPAYSHSPTQTGYIVLYRPNRPS